MDLTSDPRASPGPAPLRPATRASSTAFDVVVFVVLVGVAVTALAGATPTDSPAQSRVAEETADVLATSTTTVEFTRSGRIESQQLRPVVTGVPNAASGVDSESVARRAHGTYAELLAAAVVADPRLDGTGLTASGGAMTTAVTEATRRVLPTDDANVQVRATWRAYPGATLSRTVVVGEDPPPTADVSVATATVDSGFSNATARLGADPTLDAVGRAVAHSVVYGLFPPDRTRDALASEGADRYVVADRYRTTSERLGVTTVGFLAEGDVRTANDRLVDELADRVRADLSSEFSSGDEAARALSVDRVRITVRTWSG